MLKLEVNCENDGGYPMDKFWERNDTILVVAGALTCIRGVYLRALKANKLHQLRYIDVNHIDYEMGAIEKTIRRTLQEVAQIEGAQVIILYLSCVDILVSVDFDNIEKSISLETGKFVKCFYRGNLTTASKFPRQTATELLAELPKEKTSISTCCKCLPVPMADIAGLSDWLRYKTYDNVLISLSGCLSPQRDSDMSKYQGNVYFTETDGTETIWGLDRLVANELKKKALTYPHSNKKYMFISSVIPSFIGIDGITLETKFKDSIFFNANGFDDAIVGISKGHITLLQEFLLNKNVRNKTIAILGYSEVLCGELEQFNDCFSYIKELGYEVCIVGQDEIEAIPALAWTVSSAGLEASEWLAETYNIPTLVSCPVGFHAMETWKRNMRELLLTGNGHRELKIHNMMVEEKYKEKILVIGDPLHVMALGHYFWHAGFKQVQLASYGWSEYTKRIFAKAPGSERIHIWKSVSDLEKLWSEADLIVTDPILKDSFGNKKCIDFPWGLLTGNCTYKYRNGVLSKALQDDIDAYVSTLG